MGSRHYCSECDQRLRDNSWWCNPCQRRQFGENFDNWTTGDKDIDDFIKYTQVNAKECDEYLKWIPFSRFIGINKLEISEVGTSYSANWKEGPSDTWDLEEDRYVAKRNLSRVILISPRTSPRTSPALFLEELKAHYFSYMRNGLIRLFGVTRESVTGTFMMVAETVEWDGHHISRLILQNKFASILEIIKSKNPVQGEFPNQINNIIKSCAELLVNELGLGEGKKLIPVIGYYRYDLLPFVSPEIISREVYKPEVDIYTFGMLMWEFSSNRPPFYDKPHDAKLINNICNGLRPKFRDYTPECYGELMQRCWSPYAQDRKTLSEWHIDGKNKDRFVNSDGLDTPSAYLRRSASNWFDAMGDHWNSGANAGSNFVDLFKKYFMNDTCKIVKFTFFLLGILTFVNTAEASKHKDNDDVDDTNVCNNSEITVAIVNGIFGILAAVLGALAPILFHFFVRNPRHPTNNNA